MYKKITKSLETSLMVGNWFASGYRTMEERARLYGWKKINNRLRLYGEWVKGSCFQLIKKSRNAIKLKGAKN